MLFDDSKCLIFLVVGWFNGFGSFLVEQNMVGL